MIFPEWCQRLKVISLIINGTKINAPEGVTILEAAHNADIYIPSLCSHPDLPPLPGIAYS